MLSLSSAPPFYNRKKEGVVALYVPIQLRLSEVILQVGLISRKLLPLYFLSTGGGKITEDDISICKGSEFRTIGRIGRTTRRIRGDK